MNRREALRLLVTGVALPLVTPESFQILRAARALVDTQAAHKSLSSHQNETVTTIAEMIIPRTHSPGAADAGVPAFIELIVTEWYSDEERTRFFAGLADVDARAQRRYSTDFVKCSQHQRADILSDLGADMVRDAELTKRQLAAAADSRAPDNFYYKIRSLILTGYYTSEVGAAEWNYQIIPDRYDGCADLGSRKEL